MKKRALKRTLGPPTFKGCQSKEWAREALGNLEESVPAKGKNQPRRRERTSDHSDNY